MSKPITRSTVRPLEAFVLRLAEVRNHSTAIAFELIELRSGASRRFATLGALQRFLQAQARAAASAGGSGPAGDAHGR